MALDLKTFSNKLVRYRNQFSISLDDVSISTGIQKDRLVQLENGIVEPSGDEILIIADYYKCDFNFFISNEKQTAFEKTELLFRRYGTELSTNDRWAIQECIFLAECENYLDGLYKRPHYQIFNYVPQGKYYKAHGKEAAKALRNLITLRANELNLDIYSDFRKAGFLIYRRRLESSSISGVCIDYPDIGKIILVNYDEDIFRQRFTVSHEVGHAIFDNEDGDIALSYRGKWDTKDLREIRANVFAASFLIPDELLNSIPDNKNWNGEKLIDWAIKAKVNTVSLLIALENSGLIDRRQSQQISHYKVPLSSKIDPEFVNLSPEMVKRLSTLLEKGLTNKYLNKCLTAQRDGMISTSRMMEMLLVEQNEILEINSLFKLGLENAY
ncbi:MAG: hypothetical protein AMQ22_01797 [Candidatus Methanofastidiosum methylothiophilum]|jgi:Zn-dependent peptidase ImmA (M78 family)|uniref:HTH cro/C1-type domain-containing protein n=1 Tax=Candidatus Methanofastidiosum methylothiophilum TaxID=1705564 RepID=A0A150IVM4_9EURY|nr:MAG: hypothetical protein AMQ22_01797 [Candidatus Methanofastidiosum methylthiophilus]